MPIKNDHFIPIKTGEMYIEKKLEELNPKCNNSYLKNKMDKSLSMLEEFKRNTKPNSTFHSTFRYL